MSFSYVGNRFLEVAKWREILPTLKWATENIYLDTQASPIAGAYSTEKTPYAEEILEDRDRKNIQEQFIFTATQWAKTTLLFICAAKGLDDGAGKAMLVIPTQDMVSTYVKDKVNPFFDGIDVITRKIENVREETKAGKLESALKKTSGASLRIAGNTRHTRSSFTVKDLYVDEARLFGSGHIEELKGRTKAFEKYGRKIMYVSSKESDTCEATLTYNKMRCKKEHRTYCPKCKSLFWAGSKEFYYPKVEDYLKEKGIEQKDFKDYDYISYAIENVAILCPECGNKIDNETREQNIINKKTKFVTIQGDVTKDISVGYKSNTLYSTLTTLEAICLEILNAKGDEEKLSRLWRDYFNEVFEVKLDNIEIKEFTLLGNGLPAGIVPKDTWKLILTIDNQKDHLYYEVNAEGYGAIKNTVAHGKVEGYGIGEDWEAMKEIATKGYPTEDGGVRYIDYVGVDRRGYNEKDFARTDEANKFILEMMEWAEDNGIEGDFIFGMEGVPKISGDAYVKVREDKINITKSGTPIKVISHSNIKIKTRLSMKMNRTIKKQKGDEPRAKEYDKKLMYVNNDIIKDLIDRMEKAEQSGREYKPPKSSYESHYTAEVFNPTKGVFENQHQKRVDYLDCGCMSEGISVYKGVDTATREEYSEEDLEYYLKQAQLFNKR